MPNRLADEPSPYLRQHKDNPVDWFPWGEEAFAKAEEEDKPVFLSIGYATCHWCHVMEEESFEDEEVARVMNEHVVAIKVDREERPDVDALYMDVCQMMNGQGGWPLNVFLTPGREPFYAATYIPKTSRHGRAGMLDLVPRIGELWETDRAKITEQAEGITDVLRRAAERTPEADGASLDADAVMGAAFERLAARFDDAHGGFGGAPKFPSPHHHLFLLRYAHRTGDAEAQSRALEVVTATLDAMRRGGIWDHVGFGFHRYSTDRRWLLPHFEKMLYDQATHLMAYAEAYRVTGAARFAQTAREVATYVRRDLTAPEGGFFCAEDADSRVPEGRPGAGEKEEGAFYVWTLDELRDALPEDEAALVIDVMNATAEGNYADEATRRRTGANVLHLQAPLADLAAARGLAEDALRETLDAARRTLLRRRDERPRPGLDDKILTDWNGLMVAALALAARTLDDTALDPTGDDPTDLVSMATEAADFLLATMRDDDGRLLHRYRAGDAAIRAHLDDLAFLALGCLELYAATFEVRWLREAVDLADELRAHHLDAERGGFYLSADDGEALLVRQKDVYDGAMPSGHSVAALVLARLARLTGRLELADDARAALASAADQVRAQPTGFTAHLMALDLLDGPAREVVIAGDPEAEDTRALLSVLRGRYTPRTVAHLRTDAHADALAALAPFTEAQTPQDGRATAYVCRDFACQAPVTDPNAFAQALDAA